MSSSSSSSSSFDTILPEFFQLVQNAMEHIESIRDDEEAESLRRVKRNIRRVIRDREGAHERLYNDYFKVNEGVNERYLDDQFRRRFHMKRRLFCKIVDDIANMTDDCKHSNFFKQKLDCTGVLGFSILQKCTSAIRQMAYGTTPDAQDEYLQMSERISSECLEIFCQCIHDLYAAEYLRKPTYNDIQRLYKAHEEVHGFPGMLGSIDCMHWQWRNCPTSWKGQYTRGDQRCPMLMLEAVASYDLWIWHAFFGVAGSNNDINVLHQLPLFNDILTDTAPQCPFTVNGVSYTKGYYLADGIYPEWATFVKSFSYPQDDKRKKFKKAQESARKDVERAFGVLQTRWAIVRMPARAWVLSKIKGVMLACIILHTMIVEDGGYSIANIEEDDDTPPDPQTSTQQRTFAELCELHIRKTKEIRDKETHNNLRSDLVEHILRLPTPFR